MMVKNGRRSISDFYFLWFRTILFFENICNVHFQLQQILEKNRSSEIKCFTYYTYYHKHHFCYHNSIFWDFFWKMEKMEITIMVYVFWRNWKNRLWSAYHIPLFLDFWEKIYEYITILLRIPSRFNWKMMILENVW